jgi:hypothetical protein
MSSITVNDAMLGALLNATGPVEVRSANGTVIGLLTPVMPGLARELALVVAQFEAGRKEFDPDLPLPADFDLAEWERRFVADRRGYSLSEVFEHLQGLTTDPAVRQQLQEQIDRLREQDRCTIP